MQKDKLKLRTNKHFWYHSAFAEPKEAPQRLIIFAGFILKCYIFNVHREKL